MEAFVLFARGKEAMVRCEEEEEEDIGCPSAGSSSFTSASDEVELADDASSSGSTTGHFEMASLMTQLPIKRGLSKFFDGKSQSFASLAAVGGLEDLPKPPAKRLKTSQSCGVGLEDAHAHRGRRLSAASGKKAARARLLSSPRKLMMRTQLPVTATPAAAARQPLLFA